MKVQSLAIGAGTAIVLLSSGLAQSRPKIVSVSHLVVYTTDPDKIEHFYIHYLSATKGEDPQNSPGVRYYFNPVQFVEVLPLPTGWSSVSRLDYVGYNTADAEGMRKYLGAHGVGVPDALTKGSDGSFYFEVKDPEENRVHFVQPPTQAPSVAANPLART